jgi:hypothetical protein
MRTLERFIEKFLARLLSLQCGLHARKFAANPSSGAPSYYLLNVHTGCNTAFFVAKSNAETSLQGVAPPVHSLVYLLSELQLTLGPQSAQISLRKIIGRHLCQC